MVTSETAYRPWRLKRQSGNRLLIAAKGRAAGGAAVYAGGSGGSARAGVSVRAEGADVLVASVSGWRGQEA
ncbi:hypothetical protein [Sporomusa termitida]|uniref:hypothetical protein n=1 Tax=Sporomusa termitida TaxID=2377 RepID=UPI001184A4CD|nr:hypothetical protein [Sporomusa termitida]